MQASSLRLKQFQLRHKHCLTPLQWRHAVRCRSGLTEQQQQQQYQQQQEAAAAAASSIRQLLTKRSYAPSRYVGPIEVAQIPGKRFGLTATSNLAVGDLLLVTTPLAVAFGSAGEAPSNDVLLQQLEGAQLEPWQLNWLRALDRDTPAPPAAVDIEGEDAAAATAVQQQGEQPAAAAAGGEAEHAAAVQQAEAGLLSLLQQLLHQGPDTANANPTSAAAAKLSIASVQCPLSTEQLQQIISGNAYSESAEDLGASLLRELDPEGVTGLWPEYSLLNHSCIPNTLAVCVGQYVLLHVTASVLAGEELTCSYVGERTFSPVAERRAYLQGMYGFHCVCERCIAEQRTFPTQYYPSDIAILGLSSSSSSSSSSSGGGVLGAVLRPFRGKLGGQAGGSAPGRPSPSAQHKLLLQQYQAVQQELRPAVQAAATADSRRQEQQLQLLAQITDAVDTVFEEVSAAVAGDSWFVGQEAAATKWLLAAVYPLLQLQIEVIELLLASGEVPVDESQLLLDEAASYSSSSNSSSSSRAMSAAAGAAAARLALNPSSSRSSSRRRQRPTTVPGWLSGLWASVTQSNSAAGGPVTKRQLLGLYAEGLGRVVGVLDAVARGSEAHVVAAIKHMDAVRQCVGANAEETALAEGLCARAHAARYGVQRGAEGQALLARLISARRRQLLGASLARKMSVLAWEAATTRS